MEMPLPVRGAQTPSPFFLDDVSWLEKSASPNFENECAKPLNIHPHFGPSAASNPSIATNSPGMGLAGCSTPIVFEYHGPYHGYAADDDAPPRYGGSGFMDSSPFSVEAHLPYREENLNLTMHPNDTVTLSAAPLPPKEAALAATFKCKWEGCKYSGYFTRETELVRHVKCVHISPRSYLCPVAGCRKVCNRKDNLDEHLRRLHKDV